MSAAPDAAVLRLGESSRCTESARSDRVWMLTVLSARKLEVGACRQTAYARPDPMQAGAVEPVLEAVAGTVPDRGAAVALEEALNDQARPNSMMAIRAKVPSRWCLAAAEDRETVWAHREEECLRTPGCRACRAAGCPDGGANADRDGHRVGVRWILLLDCILASRCRFRSTQRDIRCKTGISGCLFVQFSGR